MLHIVNLEEIQNLRLRIPKIIHSYEKSDLRFTDFVKEWLSQAEQMLVNNRLAVAADVAVLRGLLINAERGVLPDGFTFLGQKTNRKIKAAVAADVLHKADEIISNAIKGTVAQITEGENIARQLVTLAQRKGLIPVNSRVSGHTEWLNSIWKAMLQDPELGPATTHLAGIVGVYDALILLDRLLPISE